MLRKNVKILKVTIDKENKTVELVGREWNSICMEIWTSCYYWAYKQITEQLALRAECHREDKAHLRTG